MEMGIGFLVGILAGAVVALIAAVIIAISRKAVTKNNKTRPVYPNELASLEQAAPPPKAAGRAGEPAARRGHTTITPAQNAPAARAPSGNTIVIGKVDSPDKQINKSLQEVRELLLHLADVISATENASGEATLAFNSARDVIDRVNSNDSPELAEAQRVLVDEIDRVLKTNAQLHSELNKANKGIAEQRRQIEELRVQARVDALTKIPNRSAFDERLNEYMGLLQRGKMNFSLLLLDIDHFKQVNDEHGHLSGDRVLRGVAARISSSIRNNDFAARYGGEEFAVIMPATDLTEASAVAERIRQDITKTNFRLDDKNIRMTVSGGMAECRTGMGTDDIIAAADKALYQAKNSGRNRVVVNNQ